MQYAFGLMQYEIYRFLYFIFFYHYVHPHFDVSIPCFINTVRNGVCDPKTRAENGVQNSRSFEVIGSGSL